MPSRMENGVDMIAFQSWTKEEFGYSAIPNLLIDHAVRNTHVPVGFWRGVNTNQNAIYMECFIDEVAHAAGKDPLEFRRALLVNSPKHLAVLNAVAEKAEWGKPLPQGGVPRHLPELRLRQLYRRGRRGVGVAAWRTEGAPHRGRDRSRLRGQSAADRGAGAGLVRVRPERGAVRRDHHRQGPRGGDQFRHLSR